MSAASFHDDEHSEPAREITPCWICGIPSRYTVHEHGSGESYQLCANHYRFAISLGELLKADVR